MLLSPLLLSLPTLPQGHTRANVIGHSYGTLVASSLAKKHPQLLAGLTLIDPVCFAMFLPHLVANTLHFDAVRRHQAVHEGGVAPRKWWELPPPKALMKGERGITNVM